MKRLMMVAVYMFCLAGMAAAEPKGVSLILDDFEGPIVTGLDGTVDAGAGNGSSVKVSADTDKFMSGGQSMKIVYDAVPGGYIWVARGYGLDVAGAAAWTQSPSEIEWTQYGAISFYVYGSNYGTRIAFDIKDAGGEMFRYLFKDDFTGWQQIVIPFSDFFVRGDWQPPTAQVNAVLDFPIQSFQFEPLSVAQGEFDVDEVCLEPLN